MTFFKPADPNALPSNFPKSIEQVAQRAVDDPTFFTDVNADSAQKEALKLVFFGGLNNLMSDTSKDEIYHNAIARFDKALDGLDSQRRNVIFETNSNGNTIYKTYDEDHKGKDSKTTFKKGQIIKDDHGNPQPKTTSAYNERIANPLFKIFPDKYSVPDECAQKKIGFAHKL